MSWCFGKEGIVERGYTEDGQKSQSYKLNADGTATPLSEGKPSTTKSDPGNAEPNTNLDNIDRGKDAIGLVNSVVGGAVEGIQGGVGEVPVLRPDGTIKKFVPDVGGGVNQLGDVVKNIGKLGGVIDAGVAIVQAINNPTPGNVTKALVKGTLAVLEFYGNINPVVGIITGILDLTGATDALFKW